MVTMPKMGPTGAVVHTCPIRTFYVSGCGLLITVRNGSKNEGVRDDDTDGLGPGLDVVRRVQAP